MINPNYSTPWLPLRRATKAGPWREALGSALGAIGGGWFGGLFADAMGAFVGLIVGAGMGAVWPRRTGGAWR